MSATSREFFCDLQGIVQSMHAVDVGLDVREYLVDDDTRREIPGAKEGLPEQLFVREEGDAVELALYIDPQIIAALHEDNPFHHLHTGNIEPFCIALEGVSHFLMVAWRVDVGRPVSALELELQAEVDKFVASWLILLEQGHALALTAESLSQRLFDSYVLREDVEEDESSRYHVATRAAKRYCRHLQRRYAKSQQLQGLRNDVREFYRRELKDKLGSGF